MRLTNRRSFQAGLWGRGILKTFLLRESTLSEEPSRAAAFRGATRTHQKLRPSNPRPPWTPRQQRTLQRLGQRRRHPMPLASPGGPTESSMTGLGISASRRFRPGSTLGMASVTAEAEPRPWHRLSPEGHHTFRSIAIGGSTEQNSCGKMGAQPPASELIRKTGRRSAIATTPTTLPRRMIAKGSTKVVVRLTATSRSSSA